MKAPRAGWVAAAGLAGLLAAGCGETAAESESGPESTESGWQPVAESPLSPREWPLAVTVGGRILVIGGSDGPLCPPNADCAMPSEPLSDAAAYDPAAGSWTSVANAPIPLTGGPDQAAVVGNTLYVLSQEYVPEPKLSFLSYDADADRWQTLQPPSAPGVWWVLAAYGDEVVAYAGSHEQSGAIEPLDPLPADLVYEPDSDTWLELPQDPHAPSFDRRMVGTDSGLVLLARDLVPDPGVDPPLIRAATLELGPDPQQGSWTELPDGEVVQTYGFHYVGGLLVSALEGSVDGGETNNWGRPYPHGGILDPATGTWSELPERAERDPLDGFMVPGEVSGERTIVSGAWALDVPTGTWNRVPEVPVDGHVQGRSVAFADTAAGGVVFLWGGSRWPGWPEASDAFDDGELLAEGWVWAVQPPE